MPLPGSIKTVTLVGDFVGPDGTPQTGIIEVELLSEWSVPASDVVVVRRLIRADIDGTGHFSVPGLAVNTDPDASGSSQYMLRAFFDDGVPSIEKAVAISVTSGTEVKYEDLVAVPVVPPVDGGNFVTVQYVEQLLANIEGAVPGYTHTQSTAATVWTITHNLGWDPAGVQVFDQSGAEIAGGVVTYTTPGSVLRIAFDIAFAGTARLT